MEPVSDSSNFDCLPEDVRLNILDRVLNSFSFNLKTLDDGLPYFIFTQLECVSTYWFKYLNSKKVYLYFPAPHDCKMVFITTNKRVKFKNDCCSIYLDFYSPIKKQINEEQSKQKQMNDKRKQMKFFRKEYHNFPPELPHTLATKHNHDISKLRFSICPYSMNRQSAELYTKYAITLNHFEQLKEHALRDNMYDRSKLPDLTGKRILRILKYYYGTTNSAFFTIFEAPKEKGTIVKSRYPTHYVIFKDLYQDKISESNKRC